MVHDTSIHEIMSKVQGKPRQRGGKISLALHAQEAHDRALFRQLDSAFSGWALDTEARDAAAQMSASIPPERQMGDDTAPKSSTLVYVTLEGDNVAKFEKAWVHYNAPTKIR